MNDTKSNKGKGPCIACPSGTSTVSKRSTNTLQYIYFPQRRRLGNTRRKDGSYVSCVADTYIRISGVAEYTCISCPENETTHERTLCSCKMGYLRKRCEEYKFVLCPAESFCRPCYEKIQIIALLKVCTSFLVSQMLPQKVRVNNCSCMDKELLEWEENHSESYNSVSSS